MWILLEQPWQRFKPDKLQSSDGIVVLSGGRHFTLGNSKIIEWLDPDRFLAGVDIYKLKKSDKLIFTGGINPLDTDITPEGDIYIREAISFGVPSESLLTTPPVFNTYQEAKAVKKLLDKSNTSYKKNIILVTSAFHMKRAKKVFEREGIFVQPYPVDFKSDKNFRKLLSYPLNWMPSASSLEGTSSAIRELIGRIFYRAWR